MAKDHLAGWQSLRATMERCSEIVCESYSKKPEELFQFQGELPPNHDAGARRHRYWVTEVDGDMVVALPGTTHPLDWSSNMRVHYTPIDGSHPAASTPTEQLEQVPCAHAGFYFRAETIPTLALLEQAAAKGLRIVFTGHSLGAAVANICTLTALQAQKIAREAAANAAEAKHARSAAAAAAAGQAPDCRTLAGSRRQKQQKQKQKKRLSPWESAASAAAVAQAEAHTNHSWCSANGDIMVSPQAALVDVVCVAFASPHWANQSLADLIEDNGWGDVFVNVVVPEDYCLNLFNNVLTSANVAERHTLSRSSSRVSMHESSSATQLADEGQEEGGEVCCSLPVPVQDTALQQQQQRQQPFGSAGADSNSLVQSPSTADKQALLYGMGSDSSTATTSSSSSSVGSGGGGTSADLPPRHNYQPRGGQQQPQQPLMSAMAGTRRKQKKQQLSFALPERHAHQLMAANAPQTITVASAAVAAAPADTSSSSFRSAPDTRRPPAISVPAPSGTTPDAEDDRLAGLYSVTYAAADTGSWSELRAALPASPSCASLSSLSSLNSTRSWTLMAYLPEVLIRTFSGANSGSTGGLDGLNAACSRDSSDGGCPDAAADAVAAAFTGSDMSSAAPGAAASGSDAAAGEDVRGAESLAAAVDCERRDSRNSSGGGMRHAKSSIDLSISSLSSSGDSSSAPAAAPLATAANKAALKAALTAPLGVAVAAANVNTPDPTGAAAADALQLEGGTTFNSSGSSSSNTHRAPLRRSMTSDSLKALSESSQRLLDPLKLSSSLAMVGSLLPSLRSVAHASRAVLKTAESIKDAAFFVPVNLFEAYLIKQLKPPMYKPVGQHLILSATGLVPQQQPIHMYPKHVHDVYWHKELALVAFREHSIVFYKRRLLQQASRR